jgi:hypothetical protein
MKFGSLMLGMCLALSFTVARAEAVSDGDFTDWKFGAYGIGGSASATVEPAGGNPGRRLKVTTVTMPAETAYATALKSDYVTRAPLDGARFSLSLGVRSGDGAYGDGQSIALLLEQDGSLYALSLGNTSVPANFATLPFSGTLTAGSFTRVAGGGPAQPALGGGVATRFGFAAGNADSLTSTQYYDNFALDVVAPRAAIAVPVQAQSIPTLSGLGLALLSALLALAGMGWQRRRR